jgi:triphosphatase
MTEQELKLHVPRHCRQSVQRAMLRGSVTNVRLRAQYFDTPDRALVKAGIALRLRLEGRRWIQTLKMRGAHALDRIELNHPRPGPTLDLSVYEGTPAHKTLEAIGPVLGICYETDIKRCLRRIRTAAGLVEVAFDLGVIRCGELALPVSELEFERVTGDLRAVFLLGLKWQAAHGLILDLRSKAERGDRLASLAKTLSGLRELPAAQASAACATAIAKFWAPRPIASIALNPKHSCQDALSSVTLECLEQITRNSAVLAEVDTAGICRAGTPEHTHQLRVGMRRLRSAWSLFNGLAQLPPESWQEALRDHFSALGTARDDDVLRDTVMPVLQAAGQPTLRLDSQAADEAQGVALVRSPFYQSWLIELLAWAVNAHPQQAIQAHQTNPPEKTTQTDPTDQTNQKGRTDKHVARKVPLKLALKKRLLKWHQAVLREGLRFTLLTIEQQHALRKRAKRLRYGLQFAENLLPAARLKHYRKSLTKIQDILGEMNDLYVARERFETIREDQPPAWFAVGWIASRLDVLTRQAQDAFEQLKKADHFWA